MRAPRAFGAVLRFTITRSSVSDLPHSMWRCCVPLIELLHMFPQPCRPLLVTPLVNDCYNFILILPCSIQPLFGFSVYVALSLLLLEYAMQSFVHV